MSHITRRQKQATARWDAGEGVLETTQRLDLNKRK